LAIAIDSLLCEIGNGQLSSTGDVDLICDEDESMMSFSLVVEDRRNTVTIADIITNTKTIPARGFRFKSLLQD
jgi:hypothetical protein